MKTKSIPRWQLQTAKARFSELVRLALAEGPQYVTRQGKETVVVLKAEEFERLNGLAHGGKRLFAQDRRGCLQIAELAMECFSRHGPYPNRPVT